MKTLTHLIQPNGVGDYDLHCEETGQRKFLPFLFAFVVKGQLCPFCGKEIEAEVSGADNA